MRVFAQAKDVLNYPKLGCLKFVFRLGCLGTQKVSVISSDLNLQLVQLEKFREKYHFFTFNQPSIQKATTPM